MADITLKQVQDAAKVADNTFVSKAVQYIFNPLLSDLEYVNDPALLTLFSRIKDRLSKMTEVVYETGSGVPPAGGEGGAPCSWNSIVDKPLSFVPIKHSSTHESSGSDTLELPWNSITGKPVVFEPAKHASTHEAGGTDVMTLPEQGLTEVSWDDVTSKPTSFTPSLHAPTHEEGGTDVVTIQGGGSVVGYTNAPTIDNIVDGQVDVDVKPKFEFGEFSTTGPGPADTLKSRTVTITETATGTEVESSTLPFDKYRTYTVVKPLLPGSDYTVNVVDVAKFWGESKDGGTSINFTTGVVRYSYLTTTSSKNVRLVDTALGVPVNSVYYPAPAKIDWIVRRKNMGMGLLLSRNTHKGYWVQYNKLMSNILSQPENDGGDIVQNGLAISSFDYNTPTIPFLYYKSYGTVNIDVAPTFSNYARWMHGMTGGCVLHNGNTAVVGNTGSDIMRVIVGTSTSNYIDHPIAPSFLSGGVHSLGSSSSIRFMGESPATETSTLKYYVFSDPAKLGDLKDSGLLLRDTVATYNDASPSNVAVLNDRFLILACTVGDDTGVTERWIRKFSGTFAIYDIKADKWTTHVYEFPENLKGANATIAMINGSLVIPAESTDSTGSYTLHLNPVTFKEISRVKTSDSSVSDITQIHPWE